MLNNIKPGVIFGKDIHKIFKLAKKKKFAIPAINCTNIYTINVVLETAAKMKSPVIIQFSYSGSMFIAGENIHSISNIQKSVLGAISAAKHVHLVSKYYDIPVILSTDHCHIDILPWIDHLIHHSEKNFKQTGHPIFSSHMLDLSKESIEKNIKICKKYLHKMQKINIFLEIELGCTGGEEDGIDNSNINTELLYTHPKDVNYAYKKLINISPDFTIAAAFGNVHGVYQPGNVHLKPKILYNTQNYIRKKNNLKSKKPINFVFHGGSGSSVKNIAEAIEYGVVKMNVDTDIQWASWKGILEYYKKNRLYLQTQLGNPKGLHHPNKKYYDPRKWIKESKLSISKQLIQIFKTLNAYNLW
ncbi:class II fructose-bisphosphate aldolase [Buchnera aphidicola]|uniref:Fructose-bisphosphate aldolase n=1 Tax=Buchnera aphidicola (Sarucallis kahawaluokalani) TaxID=1241878 RepID=A0A4D6YDA7_9GAMM|nr:class II fructose-bisphosphate aldolase [Buchnera aphidicola]QCI26083.1 class II fructose-bisphosphate aldolase [Buchnera aphidicola (Sarucallis kahawaluokalani)]